jgi:hypothetical protein
MESVGLKNLFPLLVHEDLATTGTRTPINVVDKLHESLVDFGGGPPLPLNPVLKSTL